MEILSRKFDLNKDKFNFIMIGILALICISSIIKINFLDNIIVWLILLSLFFMRKEEIIYMIISLIPFYTMMSYATLLLGGLLIYMYKINREIKLNSNIILIILLILWECLHLTFTNVDLDFFFTLSVILIWFGLITFDKSIMKEINKNKLIVYFALNLILLGFLIIIELNNDSSISNFLQSNIRLGTLQYGNSVFNINPNTLALYSICSVSMLVNIQYNINKSYLIIIILLTTLIGLLTYSRAFVFSLFILIILTSIKNSSLKKNIYLFTTVLMGGILVFYFFPNIVENILERFDVDDISNSRFEIFDIYNNFLVNNPISFLLGVGSQNYQLKTGISVAIHNPIQEIIVIWGIIGLLIVIVLLIFAIREVRVASGSMFTYVPIIIYFIAIQSSRIFTTPTNILLFLAILLSCKMTEPLKEY